MTVKGVHSNASHSFGLLSTFESLLSSVHADDRSGPY